MCLLHFWSRGHLSYPSNRHHCWSIGCACKYTVYSPDNSAPRICRKDTITLICMWDTPESCLRSRRLQRHTTRLELLYGVDDWLTGWTRSGSVDSNDEGISRRQAHRTNEPQPRPVRDFELRTVSCPALQHTVYKGLTLEERQHMAGLSADARWTYLSRGDVFLLPRPLWGSTEQTIIWGEKKTQNSIDQDNLVPWQRSVNYPAAHVAWR